VIHAGELIDGFASSESVYIKIASCRLELGEARSSSRLLDDRSNGLYVGGGRKYVRVRVHCRGSSTSKHLRLDTCMPRTSTFREQVQIDDSVRARRAPPLAHLQIPISIQNLPMEDL
jgi:hypothetical protein